MRTRTTAGEHKKRYMDEQIAEVKADTSLLEGDKDLLFPYQQSIDNAENI